MAVAILSVGAGAGERPLDLVIAIDASESAGEYVGADVDRDGVVGGSRKGLLRRERDPDDTLLGVQVAAARRLLEVIDPATRVCVVRVAGDREPFTPDASVVVEATHDFDAVARALERLLETGPDGLSNWTQGLILSTAEALGTPSARSSRREDVERHVVFIAASRPVLPAEGRYVQNAKMAAMEAARGGRFGIHFDIFAVGPRVEVFGPGLEAMAVESGGTYARVEDPARLIEVLPARYAPSD